MQWWRKIVLRGPFVPLNTHVTHNRIAGVAAKLDITGRATAAGLKEEPRSDDTDLDENQRIIEAESEAFVGAATRAAAAEIAERVKQVRELMPHRLETALEQVNIKRQVAEVRDRYRGDLDRAFVGKQRKLSLLRGFEESHRRDPLSCLYGSDKTMFTASLVALTIGESAYNTWTFEPLQTKGLLGGLVLASSVSVANVLMGLGTGWLGWRLMSHVRLSHKLLGTLVTGTLTVGAASLHLALGQLRETITHNANATINFMVILDPPRWFAYTGIAPFVVVAIGAATFLIAAFKGRGGKHGICSAYWGHDVLDREFRVADAAFEDAKENLIDSMMNAFDSERSKLRERHAKGVRNVEKIRGLVIEAGDIERNLRDSIDEELGRQVIWLRAYRERNRAVRNTPAPAYFATYPAFNDLRSTRLDLSELNELGAKAEQVIADNATRLAELEEKTLQEQTAIIDGMLTTVSASERRAAQQIEKDDGPGPRKD